MATSANKSGSSGKPSLPSAAPPAVRDFYAERKEMFEKKKESEEE